MYVAQLNCCCCCCCCWLFFASTTPMTTTYSHIPANKIMHNISYFILYTCIATNTASSSFSSIVFAAFLLLFLLLFHFTNNNIRSQTKQHNNFCNKWYTYKFNFTHCCCCLSPFCCCCCCCYLPFVSSSFVIWYEIYFYIINIYK